MQCPTCNGDTRVLESRAAEGGAAVRRRRECTECGRRFTTFERRVREQLFVRKRDGRREPFDRAKLAAGLFRAAHKRPVDPAAIEALVMRIEDAAEAAGGELEAARIGEMCLAGLRELDRVAYLQFAAVYKGFSDPSEFTEELRRLGVEPPSRAGAGVATAPARGGGERGGRLAVARTSNSGSVPSDGGDLVRGYPPMRSDEPEEGAGEDG
jgi:transcriptional repressor NrdR